MSANNIAGLVQYWDILSYVESQTNWSIEDADQSGNYVVFYGPVDINNNPLEIVFLRDPDAREQGLYISNALEVLSAVDNISPTLLAQNINAVNKDVLRIRIEGGVHTKDALPLRAAAQQINELKQLVAYAARSEVDKKPYYLNAQHPSSKNLVDVYRFGHTFKGSFGYTIETPPLLEIHTHTQLSLIPERVSDKSSLPLWRKVMERIAHGLVSVKKATNQGDPNHIIDNYERGLNANMCQSLAKMFTNEHISIEYSIKWASIKLPDDPKIKHFAPIQLSKSSSNQLTYAATELVETHEEEVTIRGLVYELSAKDSPMVLDTSRTIRIRWHEASEGKKYQATATLSRRDYQKAIEAHKSWDSIQITGTLSQKKNKWRFTNYSEFEVMPGISEDY